MINRAAKYFPDPHPALAQRLDSFLSGLADSVSRRPELAVACLILAGGYGRGEGGVFVDAEGNETLYNDLEFYLISTGEPLPSLIEWVRATERSGTAELGIHVEIKLMSEKALRAVRPSMFFYDLVSAHQVIVGPENFLIQRITRDISESWAIPLHEATRLLFNRGSGLFFCAAKFEGLDPEPDEGFIQRNHAKLKLALGDAVLAAGGAYHWSCLERAKRLRNPEREPPNWQEIVRLHAEGIDFKLHPRHPAVEPEELRHRQRMLVTLWSSTFLWLELLRLHTHFEDLSDYARWRGRVLPEFPAWKNILCRIRDVRNYDSALPRWTEYPRGVLQQALAGFLSGREQLDLDLGARILGVGRNEAFETYRRWWSRYN